MDVEIAAGAVGLAGGGGRVLEGQKDLATISVAEDGQLRRRALDLEETGSR